MLHKALNVSGVVDWISTPRRCQITRMRLIDWIENYKKWRRNSMIKRNGRWFNRTKRARDSWRFMCTVWVLVVKGWMIGDEDAILDQWTKNPIITSWYEKYSIKIQPCSSNSLNKTIKTPAISEGGTWKRGFGWPVFIFADSEKPRLLWASGYTPEKTLLETILSFWRSAYFQGRGVSFRDGISHVCQQIVCRHALAAKLLQLLLDFEEP